MTTAKEIAQDRLDAQEELEDRAVARGAHRFDRRLEEAKEKDRGSTHGAGKKLLLEGWPKLAEGIEHWCDEQLNTPGRPHTAAEWIEKLGYEEAAAITLKVVLDGIHRAQPLRHVAREVADRIIMELRSRRLKEEAPGLFKYRVRTWRNTSHYRHMKNSMNATIRYSEVDVSDLDMSQSHRILTGTVLLDLLRARLGLIEVTTQVSGLDGGKYKQEKMIQADDETRQWMSQRNDLLREHWPIASPMVVPPLRWGPGERGGYRFALRGRYRLVRGPDESQQDEDMEEVYNALNAVQETSYCINLRVLEVLKGIVDADGGRANVPTLEELPMPPKPADIDENEEAKVAWKKKARRRHLSERDRQGEAATFLKTFNMAKELQDEEELYWPHNLDFRGRVYPIPDTISPQGPDLHRGLLQFAEGKELGPDGTMWLAIHGANCVGDDPWTGQNVDKRSLQGRVDWVKDNSPAIVDVAKGPAEHTWWQDVDEPWQFLAFAFEWRRLLQHVRQGNSREEFVSFLPVSVDGTCNGLQHYAALLRDREGGKAVNLLPTDAPQDFYTEVLEATKDQLEQKVASDNTVVSKLAASWLRSGWVDRSIVKRPSMTFGYGSKRFGFSNQIQEHLKSNVGEWELRDYFTDDDGDDLTLRASAVLADCIWEAIGNKAEGAFKAMRWIKESVRAVAKDGNLPWWEVPVTGFRTIQTYQKSDIKQVKTVMSGKVIQPSYRVKDGQPDSRKQASAAPPNMIHSFDAACLVMAVNDAVNDGVTHFSVVHDSFATHAGVMTTLSQAIRQAFVEFHQYPVLQEMEAQLRTQVEDPDDIPEPPERGDLDLGQVLISAYFFS